MNKVNFPVPEPIRRIEKFDVKFVTEFSGGNLRAPTRPSGCNVEVLT